MSLPPPTRDEAILGFLRERGPAGSVELAVELEMVDRTVRYGLRRLIDGGYVFSPERGRYRITALGVAALAPLPSVGRKVEAEAAFQPLVGVLSPTTTPAPTSPVDEPRNKLYARMRRRR
jgi:DNA-binding IclR family transcriptional regulator